MRLALDTNVLAYAEGVGDAVRCRRAVELISALDANDVVLPVQVLGELFNVLTRKAGRTAAQARDAVLSWADAFEVADTTHEAMTSACDLAAVHQLSFWDALIVSVAARQHSRLLLSEDLNEGFVWQGVTVVNPFAPTPHRLLEALVRASPGSGGT